MKKENVISYLIHDGNTTGLSVALALIIGILIIAASLYFFSNQTLRILGLSLGLVFVAFGGYSAQAATIGLKPFDNSYKKAKSTYSEANEENKTKNKQAETKNNHLFLL